MAKSAWSSSSARLTRESFLPFASCWLCLEPAIDPVTCSHGDIFCRECALNNILAQKKEIKRTERTRELQEKEVIEDQARKEVEAQERAVSDFELTQAGLSINRRPASNTNNNSSGSKTHSSASLIAGENGTTDDVNKSQKRKFSLDQDEIARIATEERTKLRKAIDEEKVGLAFCTIDHSTTTAIITD